MRTLKIITCSALIGGYLAAMLVLHYLTDELMAGLR